VAAEPTNVTADGVSVATLTVTAEDAQGDLISGASVILTSTGSEDTFSPASGTTNVNGVFTATVSTTLANDDTITATISGSVVETTPVDFVPGQPSPGTSTLVASPTSLAADGAQTTTVTLTLDDAYENPIPGAAVALTASGSGNTFSPDSGSTDSTGAFSATLDSTVIQIETVTATIGNFVETTTVTFTAVSDNWTGGGNDGLWSDSANWSAGIPGANDAVNISGAVVTFDASASPDTIYSLSSSADATIDITGGTLTVLDGVSNASTVNIEDHTSLQLQGAIDNSDTIVLDSSNNPTNLQVNADGATLSGGGVVTMSDDGANHIEGTGDDGGTPGTDVLTNADNTIEGAGTIGGNGLGLVNEGTIDATHSDTQLIISTGTSVSNTGTLEASNGGKLLIDDSVSNSGAGNALIEGGTIDFAASSNVNEITFNNGGGGTSYGEVIFGNESSLNNLDATVNGFAGTNSSSSDIIDLAGTWTQQSETSSGGNTTLVLADTANGGETLTLTFDNFTGGLNLGSDGHSGTEIYDPPGTGSSSASSNSPSVSIGGAGNDSFVFHPGMGAETISNFNSQDIIELDHFANLQNLQQLASDITSNAHGDALIELGHGDSVTVAGMTAAQLQAHLTSFVHLH
jgi:hypothetical protein